MRPTPETHDEPFAPSFLLDLNDLPEATTPAPAPARRRPASMFEIGVVYKKGSTLFLAVSDRLLITLRGGEVHEVRPITRYDVVRSLSVQELCATWGITLDRLDAIVLEYLAPSQELARTRPRGSRRQRAEDAQRWRDRRTVRLLAG